jgi:hypothetical protein
MRDNAVNHRRNGDDSDHGGEHGKVNRPSREQAEATQEGNPTSSTLLLRVVVQRPLDGKKRERHLS